MRRIVRRIQIDRDPLGLALQAPAMPLDHGIGKCHTHPVQIRPIKSVLEARERRLRSQILTLDRIATTQQLLDGVGAQSPGIIAIRITAGDGVQPLAHQIPDRVPDLARLASVIDAADQSIGQSEPPIAGLQQDRTAIGTGVLLVKFDHDRLARQIRKQNTLSCAIVIHAKAFFVTETLVVKHFYHDRGLCVFSVHELFRLASLNQAGASTTRLRARVLMFGRSGSARTKLNTPPI